MEIRAATISFSKNIAKSTHCREMEIRRQLDVLDDAVCNNFHPSEIDLVLKEFDNLKTELQSIYEKKGMAAVFRSKCRWIEMGERPQNISLISRKGITSKNNNGASNGG